MKGGFDAVEIGDGYETQGRTITEADVTNFAGVSGDFNHLHTDAELMGDSPVGQRVAHGTLVLAVTTGLLWQSRSPEEREHLVAFYGMDRLRFVEPVFIGDTIHVETELVEKTEKDHPLASGIVRQEVTTKNQHDETVLSVVFLLLVR
jgi:acyl dehydratase